MVLEHECEPYTGVLTIFIQTFTYIKISLKTKGNISPAKNANILSFYFCAKYIHVDRSLRLRHLYHHRHHHILCSFSIGVFVWWRMEEKLWINIFATRTQKLLFSMAFTHVVVCVCIYSFILLHIYKLHRVYSLLIYLLIEYEWIYMLTKYIPYKNDNQIGNWMQWVVQQQQSIWERKRETQS